MKKLLKRLLKPVLRPFIRPFEALLNRIFHRQLFPICACLERLEHSLSASTRSAEVLALDVDLLFESLVREMARLQTQVATLQAAIDRVNDSGNGTLNYIGTDESEWRDPDFRAKVG